MSIGEVGGCTFSFSLFFIAVTWVLIPFLLLVSSFPSLSPLRHIYWNVGVISLLLWLLLTLLLLLVSLVLKRTCLPYSSYYCCCYGHIYPSSPPLIAGGAAAVSSVLIPLCHGSCIGATASEEDEASGCPKQGPSPTREEEGEALFLCVLLVPERARSNQIMGHPPPPLSSFL